MVGFLHSTIPAQPLALQVMIEEKVKVVETAGRNPEKVIKQCKDGCDDWSWSNW